MNGAVKLPKKNSPARVPTNRAANPLTLAPNSPREASVASLKNLVISLNQHLFRSVSTHRSKEIAAIIEDRLHLSEYLLERLR